MEVAKEKNRARHAWLYQAEEEFEKVSLGAGAESPSGGVRESQGQGTVPEDLSDPHFSPCDAEAEG